MADANQAIKGFLIARMYRHWRVNRMSAKASRLTEDLFRMLHADPSLLPDDWRARAGKAGSSGRHHCWRLRGRNDRPYAMDEYRRLTDVKANAQDTSNWTNRQVLGRQTLLACRVGVADRSGPCLYRRSGLTEIEIGMAWPTKSGEST